jgi:hypothetical protein
MMSQSIVERFTVTLGCGWFGVRWIVMELDRDGAKSLWYWGKLYIVSLLAVQILGCDE